jgi:hypothetical protein
MFTFLSLPCHGVQGTSVKGSAIIKQNTLFTFVYKKNVYFFQVSQNAITFKVLLVKGRATLLKMTNYLP